MAVLIPAYGMDYGSAKAAEKAYLGGMDWILRDPSSRWNGMNCSCRDFIGVSMELRYNKLRSLTVITYNPPSE